MHRLRVAVMPYVAVIIKTRCLYIHMCLSKRSLATNYAVYICKQKKQQTLTFTARGNAPATSSVKDEMCFQWLTMLALQFFDVKARPHQTVKHES